MAEEQEFFCLDPIEVHDDGAKSSSKEESRTSTTKSKNANKTTNNDGTMKPRLERRKGAGNKLLDPDDAFPVDFDVSRLAERRPSKLAEALLDDLPSLKFLEFERSRVVDGDGDGDEDPFSMYRATSEEKLAATSSTSSSSRANNNHNKLKAVLRISKHLKIGKFFRSGSDGGGGSSPGTPKAGKKRAAFSLGGSSLNLAPSSATSGHSNSKGGGAGSSSDSVFSPAALGKKLSSGGGRYAFSWDNAAAMGAVGKVPPTPSSAVPKRKVRSVVSTAPLTSSDGADSDAQSRRNRWSSVMEVKTAGSHQGDVR